MLNPVKSLEWLYQRKDDHFVPVFYSLSPMDEKDEVHYFFEDAAKLPAFSEHSFIIDSN